MSEPAITRKKTTKIKRSKPKRKRPVSRYFWYSGWELSPSDFKQVVCSVPEMELDDGEPDNVEMEDCIAAYAVWRHRAIRAKAPIIPPPMQTRNIDPKDLNSEVLSLFFPTRSILYQSDDQVKDGHPDAARIKTVAEVDAAKLVAFCSFVKERGGDLNPATASFTFRKEKPGDDRWF
ncbi:hypothetical protein D9611_010808 [Ephemerocybe angulata]|uniref:Uncharacterized protein n=1 Tax=Ephemerocybe angulata TaxID=980116 RepID=A0A8H5F1L8_9AGAR|nr:hypothetical protein D9611_010808 [Tulosesus angulatus]